VAVGSCAIPTIKLEISNSTEQISLSFPFLRAIPFTHEDHYLNIKVTPSLPSPQNPSRFPLPETVAF